MTTTFHVQRSNISQVTSVFEMWKIGAVNNLQKWLSVSFACISNNAMQQNNKTRETPMKGRILFTARSWFSLKRLAVAEFFRLLIFFVFENLEMI